MYSIQEKIKETEKNKSDYNKRFEYGILKECPYEKHILYPGKLYVLSYFPVYKNKSATPLYDTNPYIMSLGPKKENPAHFYGINMHIIPYSVRVQIFEKIYVDFKNIINKEIDKFPDIQNSIKQNYIKEINTDLITNSPFNADISACIHCYNLKYIKSCQCINYNLIHYMLLSENNTFMNGSIKDAQSKFIESVNYRLAKDQAASAFIDNRLP